MGEAQLGHQANRVVNLELAEAFGEAAWRRHAADLAAARDALRASARGARAAAERVNAARRADQERLAPEILRAERRCAARLEARGALEAEVAGLRARGATQPRNEYAVLESKVVAVAQLFAAFGPVLVQFHARRCELRSAQILQLSTSMSSPSAIESTTIRTEVRANITEARMDEPKPARALPLVPNALGRVA